MATLEDKSLWENQEQEEDDVGQDILRLAPEEITNRTRLLENDVKVRKKRKKKTLRKTSVIKQNFVGHEIRNCQTST